MTKLQLDLTFRPYDTERDEVVIYSAFQRGFRKSRYTWGLDSDTLFPLARRCLTNAIREWKTLIAVPDGAPSEVAGFIIHNDAHKHRALAWLYTARNYRRLGVATSLLGHAGFQRGVEFDAVFARPDELRIFREKGWRPCFVPYRAWALMGVDVVDESLAARIDEMQVAR